MSGRPQKRLGSTEIAGLLRREIGKGTLAAKDRLPPERMLAETYDLAPAHNYGGASFQETSLNEAYFP
ncbi:MAG: hypothetical protein VST68_08110 [Nitrospirota bacterium]|nr:hypothetical protein [Nitrospirota bacterium]